MNLLRASWRPLLLVPVLGLGLLSPARAEEMALPVQRQVELLLTILPYDRNLATKAGSELGIGIVYDPADRDSAKATTELGNAFPNSVPDLRQVPRRSTSPSLSPAASAGGFTPP